MLTKEYGLRPLAPLFATQQYFLDEVRAGVERGIHEFVILKGRQQGLTTICDALDLWYLQSHAGMIGMLVSNDEANMKHRRLMLRAMLGSLRRDLRYPVEVDNLGQLVWRDPATRSLRSMLLFANAGKREDSNESLGRSIGLTYLHADEVGAWMNDKAVSAVNDAKAEHHEARLYTWGSTAQAGHGPLFQDIWETAQAALTQRAIFIGWWRHHLYRWPEGSEIYRAYCQPLNEDERRWSRAIKKLYGVTVTMEQWAWYRWRLVEKYRGDETMRQQEHPCLAADAFVSFGEHFMPDTILRRLRSELDAGPTGTCYRYVFSKYFDDTTVERCAPMNAQLRVYAEPEPHAAYVLAAHPWGSSSRNAKAFCVQVWRAWPDRLDLVAEFHAESMMLYQFAWVVLHLSAAYVSFADNSHFNPVYWIIEIGWAGERVLAEIDRIKNLGYGLSPSAAPQDKLLDVLRSVEYLFRRIDTFGAGLARHSKTTPENRYRVLHAMRDEIERRHVGIPSAQVIAELADLRLAESGDGDDIGGGAGAPETRAITCAMAVAAWHEYAMPDLRAYVAPKGSVDREPEPVGQTLVASALHRVRTVGRM